MSTTLHGNSVDPVMTDGRDIDPDLGKLGGEAGGQEVIRVADRHLEKATKTWEQVPARRAGIRGLA